MLLFTETISVITNDGRNIVVCVLITCSPERKEYLSLKHIRGLEKMSAFTFLQGILKGFDQATNLILDESHERVYSTKVSKIDIL